MRRLILTTLVVIISGGYVLAQTAKKGAAASGDTNVPAAGAKVLEGNTSYVSGNVTVDGVKTPAKPTNDCCEQMKWNGQMLDQTNPQSIDEQIKVYGTPAKGEL